jgi:hypothetical protein
MNTTTVEKPRLFLSIERAAKLAKISVRQFRRYATEELPVLEIGDKYRRYYLQGKDFYPWLAEYQENKHILKAAKSVLY